MDLPQNGGRRVAFFGGSFDPPHLGHLAVARTARAALGLDTVLFAPVGAQPLKPDGSAASFPDRLAMTCLAIGDEPGLAVSLADAPKSSGIPNFTLETLKPTRRTPSESVLFCLMGADSFFALRNWHRAAEIPFAAPLIVASRPGQGLEDLNEALPEGLTLDSALRADQPAPISDPVLPDPQFRWRNRPVLHSPRAECRYQRHPDSRLDSRPGRPASGASPAGQQLLPKAVLEYIRSHHLYR